MSKDAERRARWNRKRTPERAQTDDFMKKYSDRKGYSRVFIGGKSKLVHRLVCTAWHGEPKPGQQVNHKDGEKGNNHFLNLEWVTNQENAIHAKRVLFVGVRPIKAMSVKTGEIISFQSLALAEEAGFTRSLIQKCIAGKRHHHKGFKWIDAAMSQQEPVEKEDKGDIPEGEYP